MIVQAVSVADEVNLVLSPEGSAALQKAAAGAGFLAQGTVVVVVDR